MYPNIKVHITAQGVRYALFDQPELISDEIRKNNFWGVYRLENADIVLRESEPGRVIDAGAHIGSFSIPMAIKHPKFKYDAFEPVPTLNLQLSTNVLLNKLDNIRTYRIGLDQSVGAKKAPVLDVCFTNHGAYSFVEEYNKLRNIPPATQTEWYDFRSIDSYNFDDIRLIKISVSGMSLPVLLGASTTLSNNNPPLFVEFWEDDFYQKEKESIKELLKAYGYKQILESSSYLYALNNEDLAKKILAKIETQKPGSLVTFRLR